MRDGVAGPLGRDRSRAYAARSRKLGGVAAGDGRVVDNTLEGRLRRADPELRRIAGDVVPELRAGTR